MTGASPPPFCLAGARMCALPLVALRPAGSPPPPRTPDTDLCAGRGWKPGDSCASHVIHRCVQGRAGIFDAGARLLIALAEKAGCLGRSAARAFGRAPVTTRRLKQQGRRSGLAVQGGPWLIAAVALHELPVQLANRIKHHGHARCELAIRNNRWGCQRHAARASPSNPPWRAPRRRRGKRPGGAARQPSGRPWSSSRSAQRGHPRSRGTAAASRPRRSLSGTPRKPWAAQQPPLPAKRRTPPRVARSAPAAARPCGPRGRVLQ